MPLPPRLGFPPVTPAQARAWAREAVFRVWVAEPGPARVYVSRVDEPTARRARALAARRYGRAWIERAR